MPELARRAPGPELSALDPLRPGSALALWQTAGQPTPELARRALALQASPGLAGLPELALAPELSLPSRQVRSLRFWRRRIGRCG